VPFNLSFTHLMVVAIVALVVLGPERLPGVARSAGNLYREWIRIKGGLEGEVREAISEFTEPFREPLQDAHDTVRGVVDDIRQGPRPAADGENASNGSVPLAGAVPALPSLGEGSDLFVPGPQLAGADLPQLAPPPNPQTVAWLEPPPPHAA
jgi:sec-independent protein translocase protein TatB